MSNNIPNDPNQPNISNQQYQQPNMGQPGYYGQSQQLMRSRNNRMIAGVCGGIAERYNQDATLIRLLFAVATLAGFSGVLAYIICWIVMPEA